MPEQDATGITPTSVPGARTEEKALQCAITGETLSTPTENVANQIFDLTAGNDVTVQVRAWQGNRPAGSTLSKSGLIQALRKAADDLEARLE